MEDFNKLDFSKEQGEFAATVKALGNIDFNKIEDLDLLALASVSAEMVKVMREYVKVAKMVVLKDSIRKFKEGENE